MFFKRIFGRKKAPEPIQLEKLSINSLEERVNELKKEKLAETRSRLNTMFDGISEERKSLLKELKKLSEAEPTEEAYPGLHKSALEARRLLTDKLTRALTEVRLQGELSTGDFTILDGKLAKMVNLTTDAIATHSRYVRALFKPNLDSIELHLRWLHDSTREVHTTVEEAIGRIRLLDSISSKVLSREELLHRIEKMQAEVKSLGDQAAEFEKLIENENAKLAQLTSGGEFKRADALGHELLQIEHEIGQVKSEAASTISGINRPLRKMEKLVMTGECQVDRELVRALELCIQNPAEVLYSSEKLASAQAVVQKMLELLKEGKISLSERERKKRMELACEIVEGRKLDRLRERLDLLHSKREVQARALEQSQILKRKAELERSIEQHKSDLKRARATIEELRHESELVEKRIEEDSRELENLTFEVIGARLKLTF